MECGKSILCRARHVASYFIVFAGFVALSIGPGIADEKGDGVYVEPKSVGVPQQTAVDSPADDKLRSVAPENSLPEESSIFLSQLKDVLSQKSEVAIDLVELPSKDFGLIIQNKWLSVMIDVPRSEVVLLQGNKASEKARWLAQAQIAPAEKVEEALEGNYGLTLGEVYGAPTPPFYSDLKGIYWDKYRKKYMMVFTDELDIENNLCVKVVIDVERAEVINESETRCRTR